MLLKIAAVIGVGMLVLLAVGWLGLRINAKSFEVTDAESADPGTVPVPDDLPEPVARYVEAAFGGEMPVIESALVQGNARLTFNGITFPGRFKFYHDAGAAYYHYIQLTWFGVPIITVNERYMDGVAIMDLPGDRIEDNPQTNAAAHLALWAESIWLPSILFVDDGVRWEAVDDTTAHMIVPGSAPEEVFTVHFDPATGLITEMSTMRYQNPASTERTLWINRVIKWQSFNGVMLPAVAELQWGNDDPWATWDVEAIRYNIDLSARFAQFGGDYQGR